MAQKLARYIPAITRKTMERFGFAYGDILNQWPAIAGPELAACCVPERISWPRGIDSEQKARRGRHGGGTLVIRVNGPMAVELQHLTPRIMERINGYYGYHAIGSVKIIQGPLPRWRQPARRKPAILDARSAAILAQTTAALEPGPLRDALARLGRGVLSRKT